MLLAGCVGYQSRGKLLCEILILDFGKDVFGDKKGTYDGGFQVGPLAEFFEASED